MFSYFGSKSKIVHLYPKPKFGLIIEPFAGSARYALKYFERDVVLIDKFHKIIEIWKYLQNASEKDILSLPEIKQGESTELHTQLSDPEKWLIGFCINRGSAVPKKTAGSFFGWEEDKKRIAKQLFKIRHWEFILGEYDCLETKATWFIDPPYFNEGKEYVFSSAKINFIELEKWIKSRLGQTIVCETQSATWMPFQRLGKVSGSIRTTTEVFWSSEKLEYQANLFE